MYPVTLYNLVFELYIFLLPWIALVDYKYPELFFPMEINIKGLLNNVNQMYISNFLWDISNIRMTSG